MEGYAYPPVASHPSMMPQEGVFPDRGDGFGDYYGAGHPDVARDDIHRSSRTKTHRRRDSKRSHSRSLSIASRKSRSQSRSRSVSHSRTQSRSRTPSLSTSRPRKTSFTEPGLLDAFRVLYLTPSKHKKSAAKYLATKKKQDRIQELLKSDGLGSKRWLFYPRSIPSRVATVGDSVATSRDTTDQRVKLDGVFFRKYKKNKKIDSDSPVAKLKRWELILYKKLGFIQAV